MAASHHGDTPYSGNLVTPVPVTPYTTSVDVNVTIPSPSIGFRADITPTSTQSPAVLSSAKARRARQDISLAKAIDFAGTSRLQLITLRRFADPCGGKRRGYPPSIGAVCWKSPHELHAASVSSAHKFRLTFCGRYSCATAEEALS